MKKEPYLRIAKRNPLPVQKTVILYLAAILAAILAGGIFLLAVGCNPIEAYSKIIGGSLSNQKRIESTVVIAIPLVITSIGIMFAFKMKFWNIGAEGQIIMGGICASYFALFHSNMNHWALIGCMFLASIVGGGFWALIPAIFKVNFGTNETLFTLMLNYVALYLIQYLREGPWIDPTSQGFPKIASFVENARLDKVGGVYFGWIIALLLVVFGFIYMKYSKHGYEVSVVGESQNTARYAGMNVKRIVVRTMFISGAVCGIAGMCQVAGAHYTLGDSVAGGVGFTAIIVAWLACLNPFVIVIVSCLFAILEKGCGVMESTFAVSSEVSAVLQGLILFIILGFEFFKQYRIIFRGKAGVRT